MSPMPQINPGKARRVSRRSRRWRSEHAVALLLLVAAVAMSGCGGGGAERRESTAPTQVDVPSVVGLPRTRATCTLADVGLRWRLGAGEPVLSKPVPACGESGVAVAPDPRIVEQRPAAGTTVDRGAVVVLIDECRRESELSGAGCA